MSDIHEYVLRTAQRIEAAARAIDLLREHEGTWWGDTDPDDRPAIRDARAELELREFVPNADAATNVDDGLDELLDERPDLLLDDPLEVYATGRWSDGTWTVTGVVAVCCTGGPHCELRWDGENTTAWGTWGGDTASVPVLAVAGIGELLEPVWDAASEQPAPRY